jgi:hypothetical protein
MSFLICSASVVPAVGAFRLTAIGSTNIRVDNTGGAAMPGRRWMILAILFGARGAARSHGRPWHILHLLLRPDRQSDLWSLAI